MGPRDPDVALADPARGRAATSSRPTGRSRSRPRGERLACGGSLGMVKVSVPLYGGKVEGWIVEGIEQAYDEEAERLERWLAVG